MVNCLFCLYQRINGFRLAFSRLSPTCHYLENAWLPEREKRCRLLQESLRTDAVLQVPFYQVDRNGKRKYCLGITCFNLYFSFCPLVSWIWMRLRDRTKQKDLAWWQRRVHVSWTRLRSRRCVPSKVESTSCCERGEKKQGFDFYFLQLANAEPWQLSHYSVKVEKPDKIHSEFWFHASTLLPELQSPYSLMLWASCLLSCLAVMREACVGFTCKCTLAVLTTVGRIEK